MKFVVVGGGVAGCGTALELAEKGHEIVLLERRNELLAGSSDDTPCRLGLGFHYIDKNTAIKYLHATIELLKKYPEFIVAKNENQLHPHRRWRYFIVKDSQFSVDKVIEVYAALKAEYRALVVIDSSNQVLGEPDNFYNDLNPSEYADSVNLDKVEKGIETAEQVLDWPAFKKFFVDKIEQHPNISVIKNAHVQDVMHCAKTGGFLLEYKKEINYEQQADFIINCAWENVEAINQKLGYFIPAESRTNRLKVIVGIELPAEFEKNGPVNSMFFCFGPHCSFTNLGDGTGFISYEPVTNIEASTDLNISIEMQRLLYGNPTETEIKQLGIKILAGVVEYIPGLKNSKIKNAKFGIVKTLGTVDIYSSQSDFHRRDYSGVEAQQLGLISNSSMKLLYFLDNARSVAELVEQQLPGYKKIRSFVNTDLTSDQIIKQSINKYLQRYSNPNENWSAKFFPQINSTIDNKQKLNKQILASLHP